MVFALILVAAMLAVLWFDVTRYVIPNWLTGGLLLLYPLTVVMAPAPIDWKMALAGAAIVFAAGYIVFAMKWMGGGDIKLITVCALWVGMDHLVDFIFFFALMGGVFSIALWILRKILPHVASLKNKSLPRILRKGEPVPYGVAIALGFLILLKAGNIAAVSAF